MTSRSAGQRVLRAVAAGAVTLAMTASLSGPVAATTPVPHGQTATTPTPERTSAASPALASRQTSTTLDLPGFGAVFHGMWGNRSWRDRARMLDKLKRTGVRWLRIGLPWSLVQPQRPESYETGFGWGLERADRVIRMAHRRGFKITVVFHRTPGWANGGRGPARLPARLGAYAQAVRTLAHRYRHKVGAWEVWNEPNLPRFLADSTHDYVRLLCRAYGAIHRGDPGVKVVFGGTAGNDWEFVARAYRYGAKGCFDVMATHPYNGHRSPRYEPPGDHRWWFQNVRLVRRVMVRHHDAGTPIWFTEVGWSTHRNTASTPSGDLGVTQRQQARFAVQMLRITAREFPYVRRAAWYAARDEHMADPQKGNFGLFTVDLRAKRSARRLREFLANHR